MDERGADQPAARVRAQHVGGIDETTVDLESGVNVLAGRNATNRTSFLQAVMAALGSDRATLKGDADAGRAEVTLAGETHERTLDRVGGDVSFGGDPLLADAELADLFAFLLEDNDARRAVERGDDLREVVVRPVDTAALRRDIERREAEKREIDDELAALDDVAARLENRRERVAELEAERDERREELADARDALADADGEDSEALAELKARRSDLEELRFQLRTERESLESLRDQRADLREERDALPDPDADVAALDDRIEELRARREEVAASVSDLQNVVEFNEQFLDDAGDVTAALADDPARRSDGGTVTDALVGEDDGERVCWTCGSTVERERIEGTVERLRDLRDREQSRKADLDAELDEVTDRRQAVAETRERREEVAERLREVEAEIERREERVADLEAEREDVADAVSELEAAVERDGHDAAVDRAKRVNELEVELDRVESDLADARETVEDLESRLAERDDLEARRREVVAELADLRERVDRVEAAAVDSFNEEMAAVLERLDYDNLERVWVERTATVERRGRENVERSEFDLHVVRETDDGRAYEDTVDHLSESEREVTGLVFALAGYLAHEVYEDVPFLLLDSLEAIDAERIAALVDYVAEYTEFLVAALLEEDARAVDADNRVTDI
ncbi:archaea-specific SMC-related protein [Halobacterium litoreum]|uniref:Archaea-specific SMC-related protein n=1 Tax=Halobacterium litoreum TaxID=2039234 RepID=A0ABD5NC23_9EURY|nr:archaea-specific SMC-related protein [Halobacterium litoreum]UHH14389.1 AAA family ATPase [Halobacterium litoreum]